MKVSRRSVLASLGALSITSFAVAQQPDSFMTKPLRIIVPFSAGSGSDALARLVGNYVSEETGQPVIVDNRPGGSGFIAVQAVTSAPPDGHTLLLGGSTTHSANPHLFNKLPYDPQKDLAPVTPLGKGWLILIVNKDLPVKNLAEFIAYVKARPGKVFMASGSPGLRVPGELLKQMAGLNSENVSYRGSPLAINDLIAGQVQWAIVDVGTAGPFIRAGTVHALAVTNAIRFPTFPDVPTMAEAGVPGYELANWLGLSTTAGTPPATLERLNKLFVRAASRPEADARIYTAGGMSRYVTTPAEMLAFTAADAEKWGQIIRAAGIPKE
ncbi:Bug family tripartite tricarboxylate transporter substrate binding protein [Hydrogenophaga sp.]|uniref:Bug family tripartite tricarboxylate transporter substrate binding protein n=1 Tax=Hydrogenophaga sp. TaxID=1904254 RepID=UPI003F6F6565